LGSSDAMLLAGQVLAYAFHEAGNREVIGLDVGESETEAFWRSFLRGLAASRISALSFGKMPTTSILSDFNKDNDKEETPQLTTA
jgi:hypothetical protein